MERSVYRTAGHALTGYLLLVAAACHRSDAPPSFTESPPLAAAPDDVPGHRDRSSPPSQGDADLDAAHRERERRDREIWPQEVAAQRVGGWLVRLWDQLRAAETPQHHLQILAELHPGTCAWPNLVPATSSSKAHQDLGIESFVGAGTPRTMEQSEWSAALRRLQQAGYQLVQSEWHHERFDNRSSPKSGEPSAPESSVHMILHVQRQPPNEERWIVEADLRVHWQRSDVHAATPEPQPAAIRVEQLRAVRRSGPPGFTLAATLPARSAAANDFLGVIDLDRDGVPELVFDHQRYRHVGQGRYAGSPISTHRTAPLTCALVADLTSDGWPDLLTCDPRQVPQLLVGSSDGFTTPPRSIDSVPPLTLPMVATAADVNGDGRLDVWIGQYKPPYRDGQMPTPYYDANDGDPSYLLINQGDGRFADGTTDWGLQAKRTRRTYSASLLDLLGDTRPELWVVSDFAGVDLYTQSEGSRYVEITDSILSDRHNFGMSHRVDDFDGDGQWDIYVTGMSSTTARRLESMDTGDPRFPRSNAMRAAMGYGNRLYLSRHGRFEQGPDRERLARTGWSWGVTTLDIDNDGDRDVYVGNGHISGTSARDYCSTFWRHDIYTGSSAPDLSLARFFADQQREFESSASWNGYEHNSLLLRDDAGHYVQVAFLLGIACEFDTRAVVSHDIDEDGRMDLLVVNNPRQGPSVLYVFRNRLATPHHWIGFRLVDVPGLSTLGAVVELQWPDRPPQRGLINSGDSFTSQHPAQVHFGLGSSDSVPSARIVWPDGQTTTLNSPAVDRYNLVLPDGPRP